LKQVIVKFVWITLFVAGGMVGPAVSAWAQSTAVYPNRVVKVIVGVDPGGPSDLITRNIAQHLTARMGQNFLVENRGGAGGVIGLRALAAAANDGYTLGWGSFSSLVLRPAINISAVPFDPEKELMPVTAMAEQAFVLAVNPSLGVGNARELVRLIKANPGKFNYGSPGAGGLPHLLFEIMKMRNGIDIQHVPYKGDAASFQALVAGHVQLLLTAPSLYGTSAERVRLLAVAAPQRSPQYPNVPTFEEEGLPGLGYTAWHALFAPAGVPKAIAERIDREVRAAMATPEARASIEAMGVVPSTIRIDPFTTRFSEETRQWKRIVKELDLRID